MLVLDRRSGEVQHSRFANLTDHLLPGDLMVFNRSRVIPARLRGRRTVTGGKVEFLLLSREEPGLWRALARPGRRLQPGARVLLDTPTGSAVEAGREYDVEVQASGEDGLKLIAFVDESIIEKSGLAPLPPYIHSRLEDPERYQTIYARDPGSAAAPTAGLHFTEESLAALTGLGVELAFVTLHVGLDTFRPVQEEDPADHKIHTEYFEIDAGTSAALNQAREQGRRIIAVGTTSVRVLEQIGHGAGGPRRNYACTRSSGTVHTSGPRVQVGRRDDHQLPSTPLHAADAGVRLRGAGPHPERLPGGNRGTIPLLQLRRRYVDRMTGGGWAVLRLREAPIAEGYCRPGP